MTKRKPSKATQQLIRRVAQLSAKLCRLERRISDMEKLIDGASWETTSYSDCGQARTRTTLTR